MKKKEISLSELKISSFVTGSKDTAKFIGGAETGLSCPKELCNTDPIVCWPATQHTCTD